MVLVLPQQGLWGAELTLGCGLPVVFPLPPSGSAVSWSLMAAVVGVLGLPVACQRCRLAFGTGLVLWVFQTRLFTVLRMISPVGQCPVPGGAEWPHRAFPRTRSPGRRGHRSLCDRPHKAPMVQPIRICVWVCVRCARTLTLLYVLECL